MNNYQYPSWNRLRLKSLLFNIEIPCLKQDQMIKRQNPSCLLFFQEGPLLETKHEGDFYWYQEIYNIFVSIISQFWIILCFLFKIILFISLSETNMFKSSSMANFCWWKVYKKMLLIFFKEYFLDKKKYYYNVIMVKVY